MEHDNQVNKMGNRYPPLNFFYTHFHNSMKSELEALANFITALNVESKIGLQAKLLELRGRYRFLEQVYKYHSSVEDEVVYPALDAKVKNVTMAYRVEHQDEELLLEQCAQLISAAIAQAGAQDGEAEAVRGLICKVEEVHRTLKKHLAKEEEQLVPLLLQHFSFAEQAALVAQFLYCIPLAMVERVLAWLKPQIPQVEQEELLSHIHNVVPDALLLQLLTSWLQAPATSEQQFSTGLPSCMETDASTQQHEHEQAARPPLKEIIHIHRTICSALEEFASETRNLQQCADVSASQLASLVERHRFLRSVCMFHTISEEEVMYPEVRRIAQSESEQPGSHGVDASEACCECEKEHENDVSALEDLGRLLSDVRAFARRGRKEVSQMLARLSVAADQVLGSIAQHMAREESQVFPLLERHLCVKQQRAMVWRTLSSMPLRLLERVLPWVTATMSDMDTEELLNNIRLGAPEPESVLVALMSRWADRGRGLAAGTATNGHAGSDTKQHQLPCMLGLPGMGTALHLEGTSSADVIMERTNSTDLQARSSGELTATRDSDGPALKRPRLSEVIAETAPADPKQATGTALRGSSPTGTACGSMTVQIPHSQGLVTHVPGSATSPKRWASNETSQMDVCTTHFLPPLSSLASSEVQGSNPQRSMQEMLDSRPSHEGVTNQQAAQPSNKNKFHPIDHIFQFHQALRQELKQLEADALRVERAVLQHLQDEAKQTSQQPATANASNQTPITHQPYQLTSRTHSATLAHNQEPSANHGTDYVMGRSSIEEEATSPQGPQQLPIVDIASKEAVPFIDQVPERCTTPALSGVGPGAGAAHGMSHVHGSTCSANEATASASTAYGTGLPKRVAAAIQALDGRFQFLWGIYRAHSRSEDEIVFPALESKQALRNVSHAYALDHQQEEQLFLDLEQVIEALKRCSGNTREARDAALAIRRMCAAMRASLETHIRAEEADLWPLFTEHFTLEEQQYLVGVIIGRTGAQVLQALVPWISESFSVEEKELMLGSLRQATRNTMFDQWLEAVSHQPTAGKSVDDETATTNGPNTTGACPESGSKPPAVAGNANGDVHAMPDPELARYLGSPPVKPSHATTHPANVGNASPQPSQQDSHDTHHIDTHATPHSMGSHHATVEKGSFRPGWEDIFRMNQKQLEAAVMRVSADPNLEPGRKAYLIQNIMVSKYIVAQQKRMQKELSDLDLGDDTPIATDGSMSDMLNPGTNNISAQQGGVYHAHVGEGSAGIHCDASGHNGKAVTGNGFVVPNRTGYRRTYNDAAHGILGCKHYRRKAALVAPCCGRVFTCRLCHDEAVSHRMDRYAVQEMVCMACGIRQPIGATCTHCGSKPARYYCNICHLFDDEPGRHIYHCPFCNVCRRGKGLGIDFFHCMECNSCMNLSLFKSHTCRERAMESNCPVCSEYLFDSADPIKELPCGHLLHSRCFAEYTRYNYTCPLCQKSVGDMSVYFQMLDSLLASERLPPEYSGRMQQILCNDCSKTGFARFHFAYHACPHCRSYNTRVL